jgi:hypothetical protein
MQLSLNFHQLAERWINLLSLMITLGPQQPLITGRDRLEADGHDWADIGQPFEP